MMTTDLLEIEDEDEIAGKDMQLLFAEEIEDEITGEHMQLLFAEEAPTSNLRILPPPTDLIRGSARKSAPKKKPKPAPETRDDKKKRLKKEEIKQVEDAKKRDRKADNNDIYRRL